MDKAHSPDELIYGRHPVLEALRRGRPLRRLLIARGARGADVDEIFALLRQLGVPYDLRERSLLDRIAGEGHQGVVAYAAARPYADFEAVLASLDPKAGFLVFLDQVQDPHNLGAIIRTAHATGADAVVLPQRHAAGLTGAVVKASAGAAEHVPVCRVGNLQKAMHQAREAGLWVAGLDPEGEECFMEVDFCRPCGLVVGSEGKGLRPLVREACDFCVRIPMGRQEVGSLNASVAAGLVLYEVFRQRQKL